MNPNQRKTLILAAVAASTAFVVAVAAFADNSPELDAAFLDASAVAHSRIRVKCNEGRSLERALSRAREGAVIEVSGVCNETVVIRTDRITLVGAADAIIDGSNLAAEAVILIDGARGIVIENLAVRNASDQGILMTDQATAVLRELALHDNATVGLSVDRSHVEIENISMTGNGTGGMDAYTSSTVLARGTIVADNNGGDGLAANGKTFLELRGAQVSASNNVGSGVSIINDSRLQIFSFPEAQGSTVTADSNGFAGIGLLGSELGVVGSQFFGSGANVLRATNNAIGYFMPAGAILSPHATAKFVSQFNGAGFVMEDGASALIIGGLDVANNGAGIAASGAGTLTLVSVPPNPSVVNGNGLDMELTFGTRATIDGVTVSSIVCDGTQLLRGSASCP